MWTFSGEPKSILMFSSLSLYVFLFFIFSLFIAYSSFVSPERCLANFSGKFYLERVPGDKPNIAIDLTRRH